MFISHNFEYLESSYIILRKLSLPTEFSKFNSFYHAVAFLSPGFKYKGAMSNFTYWHIYGRGMKR